jgi:hypothetical protein
VWLLENRIAKSTDSAGNKELAYCSDRKRREEEIFQTATFAYSCSIRDSRIQDPLPNDAPASESQTSSSDFFPMDAFGTVEDTSRAGISSSDREFGTELHRLVEVGE